MESSPLKILWCAIINHPKSQIEEMIVNHKLEKMTSFPIGAEIFYIKRVCYIDEEALIIDHIYFRKDIIKGLTKKIIIGSIYEYIENKLAQNIMRTS